MFHVTRYTSSQIAINNNTNNNNENSYRREEQGETVQNQIKKRKIEPQSTTNDVQSEGKGHTSATTGAIPGGAGRRGLYSIYIKSV